MAATIYDYSQLENYFLRNGIKKEKAYKELSKRLCYFAIRFQKTFNEKISDYWQEAVGDSTKFHGRTKIAQFFVNNALGGAAGTVTLAAGYGMVGFKPIKDVAEKMSDKVFKPLDSHKNKAINITSKLEKFYEENYCKLSIKIAILIFYMYEQQLLTQFNNEQWLTVKEALIKDVVKRIVSHIDAINIEEIKEENDLERIIMESFTNLQTSCSDDSFLPVVFKRIKRRLKINDECIFHRFDRKSGIVFLINRESKELKYFWNGKEATPKLGFKLMPFVADSEKIFKDAEEMQEYKEAFKKYEYLLIDFITEKENLNAIIEIINKIREESACGDPKDMHSLEIKTSKNVESLNKDVKEVLNILKDNKKRDKKNEVKSDILSPVATFTGRRDELKEIFEKLHLTSDEEDQGRIWHTVCICGLGGMGKTELTRKYVQLYREDYNGNVYWINADNVTYDASAIKEFYENEINTNSISSKILIVLDNAHKFDDVEPFFPKQRIDNVFFLITSRSKIWDAGLEGEIKLVELKTFKEGRELIKKKLPLENEEDIKVLIEIVGGLPLALQQAISFIVNRRNQQLKLKGNACYTISDYVKEFKKSSKTILDKHFGVNKTEQQRYFYTVYNTWNVTFKEIERNEEHGQKAIEIMRIIAYLRPIFNVEFLTKDNDFDEDAILLLEEYSLINFSKELIYTLVNVHRLVQEVIRMQISIQEDHTTNNPTNLEETVLTQLIFLKDIFVLVNLEVFLNHLLHEKYKHILKKYYRKTPINKIPFPYILTYGDRKIFEIMYEEEWFEWEEKEVKETIANYIHYILDKCDLNFGNKVVNKLREGGEMPKEKLYDLINKFIKTGREDVVELLSKYCCSEDELKRQAFKLLALLFNEEKRIETFAFLSQIKEDNLATIFKIASTHFNKICKIESAYGIFKLAINSDHPGILDYFLKHLEQNNTLHLKYAIRRQKENAFYKLANETYLQANKDTLIRERDKEGLNLFDFACVHGTLTMVKRLQSVDFKNDVNLILHLDYYTYCHFEVFKYMFNNNATDSLGRTALFYAARAGRVDLLGFLIKEKGFAIEEDKEGNSLLHYAVSDCDMSIHAKKHYVLSGRICATKDSNYTDLIKFLIKTGVDPSKTNVYGQTSLMVAANYEKQAMKCLLSNKTQCDCDGRTSLHYVAMNRNYEKIIDIIKTQLYSSTTFSFFRRQEFQTSLYIYESTIKILLGSDANNFNWKDHLGCFPTHYACMNFHHITQCEYFVFKSDDWSSLKDNQGNTPLHYAAIAGNILLLNELRRKDHANNYSNLNVAVNNKHNQSLLHLLASSQMFFDHIYNDLKNVLDWLINEKHLDINLKDHCNLTPIDYANKSANQDFIKAVEEITSFQFQSHYELPKAFL